MQTRQFAVMQVSQTTRHESLVTQQSDVAAALDLYVHALTSHSLDLPVDIKNMLGYIQANLFRPSLSAEEIKGICRSRNNNIATRFRQAVGVGIWEYVVRCRLDAAACVLSRMRVNMYILAAAVGYSEEAFSRAFKNAHGCSPRAYHLKTYRCSSHRLQDNHNHKGETP